MPLRLVDVDPVDVATLSAAAAALGAIALREPEGGGVPAKGDLVAVAARISGLLDLADTAESIVLREYLAAAGPGGDVVLTSAVEEAYRITAARIDTMWPRGHSLT
ncbi:hypothetical protein [Nonomuraea ceibae]|uniref:hypothetical protein n=1 Tax=Nonomuraea ceibae TaxID=1935170 RepID=UPI001C5F9CD9|nr:hypothetical protein [Nonomuraea ceibae]